MTSSSSAQNFSSPEYKMAIWNLSHGFAKKNSKKGSEHYEIAFDNEHIVFFCLMASSPSAPNFSSPEYKIAILTLAPAIWSLSHGFAKKNSEKEEMSTMKIAFNEHIVFFV